MRNLFGIARKKKNHEILPDEVFIDASNLPGLDAEQFEGRVLAPVSRWSIFTLGTIFILVAFTFSWRSFDLQVSRGEAFALASRENLLDESVVFAERGIIYDKNGTELAWNEPGEEGGYSLRNYIHMPGLAHVLGFVRYPKTDKSGSWWRSETVGASGVEQSLDDILAGENGRQIIETDAHGNVVREQIVKRAVDGENVTLSIDSAVQNHLYSTLLQHARTYGFTGGASVILDIETGEIIALTSFPEYDVQNLADGDSEAIAEYADDARTPFLNRAVSGVYTPGSIVKPIFAAAALSENIISPEKKIYSPGYISIPNPYYPDQPTIMRDWRANGWTNMREAISVSSDVYFYAIGGGYEDQKGLGITLLDAYARLFGLGEATGIVLTGEVTGTIPTPEWKEQTFDGDPWRLGDTYNTAIGQYGFQITPIQAARAIAAIANGGTLLTPSLLHNTEPNPELIGVSPDDMKVIREGMRLAVTSPEGTARSLNIYGIDIAGKTGTAQVGNKNQWMHSWVIGFWPADKPHYAFSAVLEHAPAGTLAGAAPAMRGFFEWLVYAHPEYLK